MNEIARTVLISAVSGLIAFGGAVLYLGGPSDPPLTRADVAAMIPPPVNIRAVVDQAEFSLIDRIELAVLNLVGCSASADNFFHLETAHLARGDFDREWDRRMAALRTCFDNFVGKLR